jgi:hypothetical protein
MDTIPFTHKIFYYHKRGKILAPLQSLATTLRAAQNELDSLGRSIGAPEAALNEAVFRIKNA